MSFLIPSLDDILLDGKISFDEENQKLTKNQFYGLIAKRRLSLCLYADNEGYVHLMYGILGKYEERGVC